MKTKALTKEERRNQIIMTLAIRIQNGNEEYATSSAIARSLPITASSKFRKILFWMEKQGDLQSIAIHKKGRFPARGYKLKEGTFQRPKKVTREIKWSSSKGVEQLELI